MKLLFKERFFTWLDSYDIYDESGNVLFTVEGKLSFGHCLDILDAQSVPCGRVKEEIFTFLPRFRMYINDQYIGQIKKEFTFFKPSFHLDCNDWEVQGDIFSWDYTITTSSGQLIATLSKQLFNFTDTYVMDVINPADSLLVLMITLAIDAAKCSSGN